MKLTSLILMWYVKIWLNQNFYLVRYEENFSYVAPRTPRKFQRPYKSPKTAQLFIVIAGMQILLYLNYFAT